MTAGFFQTVYLKWDAHWLCLTQCGNRNGQQVSKVLFERVKCCVSYFPTGHKCPCFQGDTVFNKWTCSSTVLPHCQWCRTLMPSQKPPAPHCQFFFFFGSTHGFLLLGCPWQRIIIWIACQSLSSTRCHPHSSALSFQLPLTLSSWPCSCFWGIFPLFLSIPILISYLFEEVMWRLSLIHPSPRLKTPSLSPLTSNCAKVCVCEYVHVCMLYSIYPLYAAHLHHSWTLLQAMSALFGFQHFAWVCARMCRDLCVFVYSV